MVRGCDRAWTIAAACLAVGVAACGDDTTHGTVPDVDADTVEFEDTATPPDADTVADTTGRDTALDDTGADAIVAPPGAILVSGIVTPPDGSSPIGWRVLNRFAEVEVGDPDGAFVIPIADDGVTATVGAPPGAAVGDTALLLGLSTRIPERDPATLPLLRLDAAGTAAALVAAHPVLADADAFRTRAVVEAARAHRATGALAARLTGAWPSGGRLLESGEVATAYAAAVSVIARELTPAWPDTSRVATPRDAGDVTIRPLDDTPAGTATRADTGDLGFTVPAEVPLAAVAAIAPVDIGGAHVRVRGDGTTKPLALDDASDLLALRDDADTRVVLATTSAVLRRGVAPAGFPGRAVALDAAATLGAGPIPLAADGLWVVRFTTGALAGPEAVRAWRDTPGDAWAALRANLLAEAARIARWVAPDADPGCFATPLTDDEAGRDTLRAAVLAGHPGPRLAATFAQLLAAVTPSCQPADDPAAPWLAPLVAATLTTAPGPVADGLAPSPASALAALRHGRGGYDTGRLLVIRGAPLAPRVDTLGGVPRAETAASPPRFAVGAEVPLTGARLDGARIELVDGAGRLRTALVTVDEAGAASFALPRGLAGGVTATPASAAGRGADAHLAVAPRIDRITPDFVYRGQEPLTLRIDGAGLAPGAELKIGPTTRTVPDSASPDGFEVTLDPATLVPGAVPVTVGAGDAVATGSLFAADAPIVLDTAPTPLYPGQTLRLSCLRVGLAPEDVHVTIDDGSGAEIAPVRALVPDGSGGVLVTATAPAFSGAGFGVATVTTPSGSGALTVALAQPPDRLARAIRFHASGSVLREVRAVEAFAAANGSHQPDGAFTLVDSGWSEGGSPWCPLDIQPSMFAIPPMSCAHPSGVCDDGWAWADVSDPGSWIDVTPPPGRLATGACTPVPGIASWETLASADAVFDDLTTDDPLDLDDPPTLVGPGVRLTLPDARGGGLVVAGPAGGGRNDVTLDLVVHDGTGTVVTLDGAVGVHIARLEIVGAPGACDVGLRITGSEDIRIDALDVSGCATGVVIADSADVRAPSPVTLFGDGTGVRVSGSTDVTLAARIGWRASATSPGYAIASGQTDGVVVEDSDRVWLDVPVAVALAGDAVRIAASRDVRVSANAGFFTLTDGTMLHQGTAVDVGVRLTGGVERARVTGAVVMNARDGVVLGEVSDVLVADSELGVRARLDDTASLPPGNRGAGIRIAPFAGIDGVVVRDVVVGRNAEAGVRVEIAEGDLRLERVGSEVMRDGGEIVPGGQPCLVSAVYTKGLRARDLVSRGDLSGVCLAGDEDVVFDGLVVDAPQGEGVFVTQSSDVVLRDLTVTDPGTDGVRLDDIGSVAVEEAAITRPNGAGIRLLGTLSAAGFADVTRATVFAPLGSGIDASATGGLLHLAAVEILDPERPGLRVASGAVRVDGARVSPSLGAAPIAGAVGLELTDEARVDAEGLVVEGLDGPGVRATARGALRLGAGTRIRDNGGGGVELGGATRATLDGARVYDNERGALRADSLEGGARLVVRGGELTGGALAVRVSECAGPDGIVDVRGGELGPTRIARCEHPLRIEDTDVDGDLEIDRVASSRLGRVTVGGRLTLSGDGDHRLDGLPSAGDGIHVAGRSRRGVRLSDMPGATLVADDAVSAAHLPGARIDAVEPGPGGATLLATGAPPHARVDIAWRAAGAVAVLASERADAGGAALARGVAAPAGQGAWLAGATLPDGSSGGDVVDDACRAPAPAPHGTAAGLAWLDGDGGVGGTTLSLPGARAASSCGARVVWSATPDGGPGELWVLDVASGDVTQLTEGDDDDDREPSVDPACGAVAWVATRSDGTDLALVDLASGIRQQVTSDAAVERSPLLTADALYYARRAPGDDDFVLVRRDRADLAASATVVYDGPGDDLWPAASPDGGWLAWTRCPAGETAPCGLAIRGPGGGATALLGVDGRCDDRRPAFWTADDGTVGLAAVRRAVADDESLGAARLVTLTPFGRATWALTGGESPVLAPFAVGAP